MRDVFVVSLADVDVIGDVAGSGCNGDLGFSIFVSTKLLAVKNPKLSIFEPLLPSEADSKE